MVASVEASMEAPMYFLGSGFHGSTRALPRKRLPWALARKQSKFPDTT